MDEDIEVRCACGNSSRSDVADSCKEMSTKVHSWSSFEIKALHGRHIGASRFSAEADNPGYMFHQSSDQPQQGLTS